MGINGSLYLYYTVVNSTTVNSTCKEVATTIDNNLHKDPLQVESTVVLFVYLLSMLQPCDNLKHRLSQGCSNLTLLIIVSGVDCIIQSK